MTPRRHARIPIAKGQKALADPKAKARTQRSNREQATRHHLSCQRLSRPFRNRPTACPDMSDSRSPLRERQHPAVTRNACGTAPHEFHTRHAYTRVRDHACDNTTARARAGIVDVYKRSSHSRPLLAPGKGLAFRPGVARQSAAGARVPPQLRHVNAAALHTVAPPGSVSEAFPCKFPHVHTAPVLTQCVVCPPLPHGYQMHEQT